MFFQAENSKTLYIAGDTIWCDAVTQAIQDYQADIIILNTGYAQINNFAGSIIMGKDDVKRACQLTTSATVVATHMEAVNHALLTRAELRAFTEQEKLMNGYLYRKTEKSSLFENNRLNRIIALLYTRAIYQMLSFHSKI